MLLLITCTCICRLSGIEAVGYMAPLCSGVVLFYAGTADAGRVVLALMLRRYHWLC